MFKQWELIYFFIQVYMCYHICHTSKLALNESWNFSEIYLYQQLFIGRGLFVLANFILKIYMLIVHYGQATLQCCIPFASCIFKTWTTPMCCMLCSQLYTITSLHVTISCFMCEVCQNYYVPESKYCTKLFYSYYEDM